MKKKSYKFLVEFLTESLEQADAMIEDLKESESAETKKRISAEREIYKLNYDIENLKREKAELMQELESYREGA